MEIKVSKLTFTKNKNERINKRDETIWGGYTNNDE